MFEPDGSTIAFKQWLHKGLTHRDFLNWAGLVSCLEKASIFLQNNLNTRTIEAGLRFNTQECLISEGKISQKIVYNGILELRNKDIHVPRIERYSENSGDVNWSVIFSRVYKVCLEVKLIEFQYCFLHDILINNFWLNTWKLREDWLCTFCNEEIEDLGYLFWECRFTQLFWKDFLKDILHGKQVTKIFCHLFPIVTRYKFFISRFTGKCATQKNKKAYTVLVYGHVYIIWSY